MNRKATLASFQFANITEQMLSLYGVEQRSVGSLLAAQVGPSSSKYAATARWLTCYLQCKLVQVAQVTK